MTAAQVPGGNQPGIAPPSVLAQPSSPAATLTFDPYDTGAIATPPPPATPAPRTWNFPNPLPFVTSPVPAAADWSGTKQKPDCDQEDFRRMVFGEFLYLRPRNAEVAYAMPVDSLITGTQIGPTALVDPGYHPGARLGIECAVTKTSRLSASYTYFRSDTSDSASQSPPNALRPLVIHPDTINAASNVLSARAQYDINFDFLDAEFHALVHNTGQTYVAYLIGARYARLQEDFTAIYTIPGTASVDTNIDFDGGGIRLGLDFERQAAQSGWLVYGRTAASFVVGEFKARFEQTDPTGTSILVNTWQAGRVVPILDLELGVGWVSRTGRWQFSGGYLIDAWFNVFDTADYIQAVQLSQFNNLEDSLTFDGLVSRIEFRF